MNPTSYYFIGIGGIGMAALARYYMSQGCPVAGYDLTPSDLTRELAEEGAIITYTDSPDEIPAGYRDPSSTLVIFTPAVPHDNLIVTWFRENGFEMKKRAEVLGLITRNSHGICFAGTHGKTTTSSMAAHLLHCTPVGCNAFLGGILRNYGSNLLLSPTSPWTVIEADEYDRSFHHLTPHIAVITSTDPDHLDIYGTEEAYLESFAHFTELIGPGGTLIVHEGLKLVPRPGKDVKVYTYGRESGDFHAANVNAGNGTITFDFIAPDGTTITDISLGVPVDINVDNAVAALAACYLTGSLTPEVAREAMSTFMGPKRRFEFWLREPGERGRVIIDDYAHHPDELKASIASVRAIYPGRRLTVAFQPHLYSRTRDFAPQFAEALSMADEVIILDIYPARELPIEGVTPELILKDVKSAIKSTISRKNLIETIKNNNFEVLMTVGAGDINIDLPEIIKNITP